MAYESQGVSQHVILASAFPKIRHLGGSRTNFGLACNDFLLFANMKIQSSRIFKFTAKINSHSQVVSRQRHETRGPQIVLAVV